MLITTSLMSLVAGAIIAALTSGFRLWERAEEAGVETQRALIAFDQLHKDLRSYRQFSLVGFEGQYDAFTVPAARRFGQDSEGVVELGGLTYYFHEPRRALCRAFIPYRLLRRLRPREQCDAVLDHVDRVRFEYFGADTPDGDAAWSGSWESDGPPLAVKATVTIEEPGRKPVSHTTLVSLARPSPPPKP